MNEKLSESLTVTLEGGERVTLPPGLEYAQKTRDVIGHVSNLVMNIMDLSDSKNSIDALRVSVQAVERIQDDPEISQELKRASDLGNRLKKARKALKQKK